MLSHSKTEGILQGVRGLSVGKVYAKILKTSMANLYLPIKQSKGLKELKRNLHAEAL